MSGPTSGGCPTTDAAGVAQRKALRGSTGGAPTEIPAVDAAASTQAVQVAFEHEGHALATAVEIIRRRCKDEPSESIERSVRLFLMPRDNGEHYYAGVTAKRITYTSTALGVDLGLPAKL